MTKCTTYRSSLSKLLSTKLGLLPSIISTSITGFEAVVILDEGFWLPVFDYLSTCIFSSNRRDPLQG
ncbi:hypothetical protein AAC387_Pa08g2414 [Persea americana]